MILTDIDFDLNTQYDGEGVKIGFIETGIPENEYLTDINYLIKPTSTYRSEHASMTSSIVKYFSPKSEFYFVAFANENHPQDYYRYMSCIDWLVEQNVNVINCSFGIADKYNLISSYTDKIISTYNITVIASSGNSYLYKDDKTGKISDIYCAFAPSNSYNTISVGSSSKDNYVSVFSTNGFRYFNDYDYKNENKKFDKDEEIEINELKLKPDILAPGGHIVGFNNFELLNGASFSAPIVTGIVSLLMQKDENYKIYPELVRSTLINSTNRARNTLIFDRDAGFGIISYEKVMNNFYLTPFTISHNKILDVFYSFDIFVENIKNIVISTSTIFNSNGGLNIEFPEPNIYGFTSYGQKIGECASVYYASKFTHSNFSGNLNFIFQLLNNNVPVNKEYRYGISYRIE